MLDKLAFSIGWLVLVLGASYVVLVAVVWLIDRIVKHLHVGREFFAFMRARARKKRDEGIQGVGE